LRLETVAVEIVAEDRIGVATQRRRSERRAQRKACIGLRNRFGLGGRADNMALSRNVPACYTGTLTDNEPLPESS